MKSIREEDSRENKINQEKDFNKLLKLINVSLLQDSDRQETDK